MDSENYSLCQEYLYIWGMRYIIILLVVLSVGCRKSAEQNTLPTSKVYSYSDVLTNFGLTEEHIYTLTMIGDTTWRDTIIFHNQQIEEVLFMKVNDFGDSIYKDIHFYYPVTLTYKSDTCIGIVYNLPFYPVPADYYGTVLAIQVYGNKQFNDTTYAYRHNNGYMISNFISLR